MDKENKYLGSNARVIKSRHFESGVVKILEQRENDLALCEKIACARLKKIEGEPEVETHSEDDDFASMILKKRTKVTTSSGYLDLHFLLPTSNLLERFFSVAGLALTNLRQRLTPEHLEQQLFLKANSKLWNIHTVSKVLNKP